jgi:hypothetical protein
VLRQHRVHEAVDACLALDLVADAEAHVEHQRQVPRLGEADGIVHRPEHAPRSRDPTLRAVGDLEAQELRARRHAVEPGHSVQIVAGGDAGHVGPVAAGVEHQVERRRAVLFAEVGGDVDPRFRPLGGPAEMLAAEQVVMNRALAGE